MTTTGLIILTQFFDPAFWRDFYLNDHGSADRLSTPRSLLYFGEKL
jgi:hypothetical protein